MLELDVFEIDVVSGGGKGKGGGRGVGGTPPPYRGKGKKHH